MPWARSGSVNCVKLTSLPPRKKLTLLDIKPATVNRRVAAISAVLTACVEEWFRIEHNPARVRSLPENNQRDRVISEGERAALIAACTDSDQPALLPMVMVPHWLRLVNCRAIGRLKCPSDILTTRLCTLLSWVTG